jgi:very-short-patch-repair endonuclease
MTAMTAGAHAASEAQLCRILRRADVPPPELNAAVHTSLGVRYIDALWRALCRGVEIDGQAFHVDPVTWQADLRRQNAIQTAGVVLLRIPARRLWTEPGTVVAEIRNFLGLTTRRSA